MVSFCCFPSFIVTVSVCVLSCVVGQEWGARTCCHSGQYAMDAHDTRFQYVKGILNTSHRVPTIVEPVVSVTAVVEHWQLYGGREPCHD
jgi:hypothetical protein